MEQEKQLEVEKDVVRALLNQGMKYKLPKRGLLRLLSKNKNWEIVIRQPYLGTLDTLCGLYLNMGLDENKLQENPLFESKILIRNSAKKAAKVVAVAMLNSKWGIRFFSNFLANRLMWRINPDSLYELVMIILSLNNTVNFTNSIRYLQGVRLTAPETKANLIEQKKQD